MPSPADQKEIVIHVVNRNSRHGPFISPHGGVVMVVTRTSAMAAQNESNAGFSKELTWQLENGILTTESSAVKLPSAYWMVFNMFTDTFESCN